MDKESQRIFEGLWELHDRYDEDPQHTICGDGAEQIKKLCGKIDTLKQQVPHWISVKDRLPKRNVPIIFMLSLGEIVAGEWDGNGWRASADFDIWVATNSIPTYWMPLPEPPKEPTP